MVSSKHMPAASRQPHGEHITAAQRDYLHVLAKKGLIKNIDTTALTRQQASALITSVTQKQRSAKMDLCAVQQLF